MRLGESWEIVVKSLGYIQGLRQGYRVERSKWIQEVLRIGIDRIK